MLVKAPSNKEMWIAAVSWSADNCRWVLVAVGKAPERERGTVAVRHSTQGFVHSSYDGAAVVLAWLAWSTKPKTAGMAATVGSSRTVADSALHGSSGIVAVAVAAAVVADAVDAVAAVVDVAAAVAAPWGSHSDWIPGMGASKCSGRLSKALLSSGHCLWILPRKDSAHPQVCCLAE